MRKGKRVPSKAGVVFLLKTDTTSRGCAITPKKVGNSVNRHSTARKIRSALHNFFSTHTENFDVVVLAHSKDLSVKDWEDVLQKALG